MEKIYFLDHLIIRTAMGSMDDDLMAVLNNRNFQWGLLFASPVLFAEAESAEFDPSKMSDKVKKSVYRYVNRFCYRATPFGLFSSVGLASWHSQPSDVRIGTQRRINLRLTARTSAILVDKAKQSQRGYLIANQTLYRVGSECRYFVAQPSEDGGTDFLLSGLSASEPLLNLIAFCRIPRSYQDILLQSDVDNHFDQSDIDDLISGGVLEIVNDRGYTAGRARISSHLTKDVLFRDKLKELILQGSKLRWDIRAAEKVELDPDQVAYEKVKDHYMLNVVETSAGGVDIRSQKRLNEALRCLQALYVPPVKSTLSAFREKFAARFDLQAVPLMIALDQDCGISYFEPEGTYAELTNTIPETRISWSETHRLLMKKLMLGPAKMSLEDADLPIPEEKLQLPPSLSVSFVIAGEKIIVNFAGGCSALQLAGRFTPIDGALLDHNTILSGLEQKYNPDVVFAEINCYADEKVSDLVTRINTYDYEISILAAPGRKKQLALDDLYLIHQSGHLMLYSKSLGKRVIPRFSSAYNYNRHNLPVFRFLCDLQAEGIVTDVSLHLDHLFPGLDFYPRVEYKEVVLWQATWKIRSEELMEMGKVLDDAELKSTLKQKGLPLQFRIVEHDMSLLCSMDNDADLLMFKGFIGHNKTLTLKEAYTSDSSVRDLNGKSKSAEFIAAVINKNPVYQQVIIRKRANKRATQRQFLPGQQWYYFKIYLASGSADELLASELYLLIRDLKRLSLIDTWFFLRYRDPVPHIRIRFKSSVDDSGEIVRQFNKRVKRKTISGIIQKVVMDPYHRELERYGPDLIEDVENIFCKDSTFVSRYHRKLHKGMSPSSPFELTIRTVDLLLGVLGYGWNAKHERCSIVVAAMAAEPERPSGVKRSMQLRYRQAKENVHQILKSQDLLKELFALGFDEVLSTIGELMNDRRMKDVRRREALLRDIIHLHINRMLNDNQRTQEMLIHFFLEQTYRTFSKINMPANVWK